MYDTEWWYQEVRLPHICPCKICSKCVRSVLCDGPLFLRTVGTFYNTGWIVRASVLVLVKALGLTGTRYAGTFIRYWYQVKFAQIVLRYPGYCLSCWLARTGTIPREELQVYSYPAGLVFACVSIDNRSFFFISSYRVWSIAYLISSAHRLRRSIAAIDVGSSHTCTTVGDSLKCWGE